MKQKIAGYIGIFALICLVSGWYLSSHVLQFPQLGTASHQKVLGTVADTQFPKKTMIITKVIDGDTVEAQDGQKIRYIGINAPESGQPYGKEAAAFNKNVVLNKRVTILFDQKQNDQYGRLLGYVYVGSLFVNQAIVGHGWAIAENIAPNTSHQDEFVSAEKTAKKKCQGLWADLCMPVSDSCLRITTIHADASGIDNQNLNDEWVQIQNNCTNTIDLAGWLLKDSSATNSYTFGEIDVASGDNLKLHSGCGTNSFTDIYWQCPSKAHAIWNNSGDEAMLFDRQGKLLSVYKY